MAFEVEETRTPTRIADMSYQFFDPDPLGDEPRAAEYSLQILDQNGETIRVKTGDMLPHAEPDEIQTMLTLLATWRARAEAQVIP